MHLVVLRTAGGEALLTGEIRHIAEHAFQTLERRYPGLQVTGFSLLPHQASFLLDFSRCDEDTARVVQFYKTEVRKLAAQKGFAAEHFWQREHEEKNVENQTELDAIRERWNS